MNEQEQLTKEELDFIKHMKYLKIKAVCIGVLLFVSLFFLSTMMFLFLSTLFSIPVNQ